MTVIPLYADYTRAMEGVAKVARRNTHLIVATNKATGEVQSWHARPRAEARDYRDAMRIVLGDAWMVRAVRVRRFR
jgi:hypothetical protein